MNKDSARKVALGAGLTEEDFLKILMNAEELAKKYRSLGGTHEIKPPIKIDVRSKFF